MASEYQFDVTFFVPCYNEEKVIYRTLDKIAQVAKRIQIKFEIIVFDDNSKDTSIQQMQKFQKDQPDVETVIYHNKVNCGLGFNYIEGSFKARGEHYLLVNGDDSETPESLEAILSHIGEADMIIPHMIDVRARGRKFVSSIFTRLVNFMSGHNLKYYNGPVLHKTRNVRRWHPITGGYAYQAEIVCLLLDHKQTYLELEITHNDRHEGESKAFRLKNILSVGHSLTQIALRRLKYQFWAPQPLTALGQKVEALGKIKTGVADEPVDAAAKKPRFPVAEV